MSDIFMLQLAALRVGTATGHRLKEIKLQKKFVVFCECGHSSNNTQTGYEHVVDAGLRYMLEPRLTPEEYRTAFGLLPTFTGSLIDLVEAAREITTTSN